MRAAESIIAMADAFSKPAFDRSAAEAMVGPVTQGNDPGLLMVQPREAFLKRVTLETFDFGSGPLLTMIFMTYAQPVPVDFTVLQATFGKPRELPIARPDDPTPLVYDLPAPDFHADVLLEVEPSAEGDVRPVWGIRLVRFPKGDEGE